LRNNESLENLKRKLSLHSASQIADLDDQIGAIKRLHASKGLLKSSATIKKVSEACIDFFERKRTFFQKSTADLPFEIEKGLDEKLMELFTTYFPDDFDKVDQRLLEVIQMTGGEQFEAKYLAKMHEQRELISENLKTEIEQFTINLRAKTSIFTLEKIAILLEVISLLMVAYLAGKWSVDPNGNYEPFIVVWGAISAALEIGRRIWKKAAT